MLYDHKAPFQASGSLRILVTKNLSHSHTASSACQAQGHRVCSSHSKNTSSNTSTVITIHNHMNYSNISNNGDKHLVRTVKERGNRPVPTSGWRSCSADGYGSELFPPILHGSGLHDGEYSGNV